MDNPSEVSAPRRIRARYGGNNFVIFALEPRAYSQAIGLAVAGLRPGVETRVVDPEDLDAEMASRTPTLVLCSRPRPKGCDPVVTWAYYRPYEDPEVIRIDDVPRRFPGLDLEDLLGLIDRSCEDAAEAVG